MSGFIYYICRLLLNLIIPFSGNYIYKGSFYYFAISFSVVLNSVFTKNDVAFGAVYVFGLSVAVIVLLFVLAALSMFSFPARASGHRLSRAAGVGCCGLILLLMTVFSSGFGVVQQMSAGFVPLVEPGDRVLYRWDVDIRAGDFVVGQSRAGDLKLGIALSQPGDDFHISEEGIVVCSKTECSQIVDVCPFMRSKSERTFGSAKEGILIYTRLDVRDISSIINSYEDNFILDISNGIGVVTGIFPTEGLVSFVRDMKGDRALLCASSSGEQ